MSGARATVGIVGARGHVGAELVRLLAGHPRFELAYVSSRELAGQPLAEHVDAYTGALRYSAPSHEALPALGADAVVLALPNGKAAACVAQFDPAIDVGDAVGAATADAAAANPVIIDLSADHRFDPAWCYGLPELTRGHSPAPASARRIANPGCYATAMQLALAPMRDVLAGAVQCFGVSGHSGAGTTPSPRNDPEALRDNLMPYALCGHVHEREVAHRLALPVEFMPHVAPHFRGLSVTVNMHLAQPFDLDQVRARYRACYDDEPLVATSDEAPCIRQVAGRHHAAVGGWSLSSDGRRLVVVAVLDNLLKGAATQALQNLNLAFGLDEFTGIARHPRAADEPGSRP